MRTIYIIIFFLAPILGFFTHELGHYGAAKCYFKTVQIHYNRTSHEGVSNTKYETAQKRNLIIAGSGPLITFILGVSGGIIFLLKYQKRAISISEILCLSGIIYLLRFPVSVTLALFNNEMFNTDEYKLAKSLGVNVSFLVLPILLITCYIVLTMFFRLSSKDKRMLLLYGLPSSIVGYLIWIKILGPWLLP